MSRRVSQNALPASAISSGAQRVLEILYQVVARFEAYRQPDESVTDSRACTFRGGQARVRSGCRPRDQSLDATETRRANRYRHAIHETLRRVEAARQLETQHAAEAVEQLARAQMIGVTFEPGIVHARDRAMLLEPARNLERALVLMPHAQRERLHPAMQQKACVRIEAAAEVVQRMLHILDQLRAPDHGARDDVGVAVEILGAAVQ